MAGLTQEQLDRFHHDGYLIVEDVLAPGELAAIRDEYREIMDRAEADLVTEGRIRPLTGTTFSERYIEAMAQMDAQYDLYQYFDICLPMIEGINHSTTMSAGPEVFQLLTHPRLLDIAESVIGPEVYSNPVQHTRIKPPVTSTPGGVTDSNVVATFWHQDAAVVDPEADATDMLTVWLAITDATAENGCLVAAPGSHRAEDLSLHCPAKGFVADIYIPESIIDDDRVVPLEMEAGSALLLHKMTEHASLDNHSQDIRWSFDLRYQPTGQPTGRSIFPGFVARSAADPGRAITDPEEWANLWWDTRDRIADGVLELDFNSRWAANAAQPLCA